MENRGWLMKALVVGMASMIVTGATSYMVFGQDKVGRSELEALEREFNTNLDDQENELKDYVRTQAPWILERGEIQSAIRQNADAVGKVTDSVDKLAQTAQELLMEQRVLSTKFDAYLQHHEEDENR